MKSPLADVLRQASAETETQAGSASNLAVRHAGAATADSEVSVEASQEGAGIEEENALELATDADSPADEENIGTERSIDDPTCLLPVLSEPGKPAVTLSKSLAVNIDDRALCRRHWIVRVGAWSPAIALLALSTAASAYALYQYATVQNLNYDLSGLSVQIGPDIREYVEVGEWSILRENNVPGGSRGTGQSEVEVAPDRIRTPSPSDPPGSAAPEKMLPIKAKPILTGSGAPAFVDVRTAFEAYQAGDYRRAETHYRAALDIDPRDRNALTGLAAVLQQTAGPDEWIPIYEKLLAQDPQDIVAASVLLTHSSSGDRLSRKTRLKVLLQRHPKVAELHFASGMLAAEDGSWAEARLAFLHAHRLVPGNANFSFNAAVCMEHLGQYKQARSYYRIASATADQNFSVDRNVIAAQLHKLTTDAGDAP